MFHKKFLKRPFLCSGYLTAPVALTGPSRQLEFVAFQSWHHATILTFPASQELGVSQWRQEVVEMCLCEKTGVRPPNWQKVKRIQQYQSVLAGGQNKAWVAVWGSSWDLFPRALMTFFRSSHHCHCFREEFLGRLTRNWGGGKSGGRASLKSGEERCISSKAIRRLPVTLARAVLFEWNCFLFISSFLQHYTPS